MPHRARRLGRKGSLCSELCRCWLGALRPRAGAGERGWGVLRPARRGCAGRTGNVQRLRDYGANESPLRDSTRLRGGEWAEVGRMGPGPRRAASRWPGAVGRARRLVVRRCVDRSIDRRAKRPTARFFTRTQRLNRRVSSTPRVVRPIDATAAASKRAGRTSKETNQPPALSRQPERCQGGKAEWFFFPAFPPGGSVRAFCQKELEDRRRILTIDLDTLFGDRTQTVPMCLLLHARAVGGVQVKRCLGL